VRLILGSGSPRRLELLAQIGVQPDAIRPPDIDETPGKGELPAAYCARIAREKVEAVPCVEGEVVLCADTTVGLGRRILGKPETPGEAAEFLWKLSGRRHRVTTAVAVRRGENVREKAVTTIVKFRQLSNEDVNAYVGCGDWRGKAGGYAIQGPAATFVPWISGSFSAVVGLPLTETAGLLRSVGYTWEFPQ